ncbi:MAG: glutamine-hydrolyzing carbamoyl-phosphate synthase small subunit [Thermoguttaceae bacterium]|jgi:carbamoyl-phosphate synthase small subunit
MTTIAKLALEDGTIYTGAAFGAEGEVDGEVCFNTSMTGYQEILTDPSYRGQIVTMTYTEIGNYGINAEDVESRRPFLAGFVVRQRSRRVSNFRADGELGDYLKKNNIVGLEGIDTRALVRRIRTLGAMKGVLSTVDLDDASLVAKAKASPGLVGRDLVREVIPEKAIEWHEPLSPWTRLSGRATGSASASAAGSASVSGTGILPVNGGTRGATAGLPSSVEDLPLVIALDYGMKWNIARWLFDSGCRVTILPGTATAREVLAYNPAGVFLSNGPGDPEPLDYAQKTIRDLMGKKPIFGICLGHQLLALACGAKTYKLKFGHRGANQPVLNKLTGRVEITTQNHGFAVDADSLPADLEITHLNLNDNTVEGMRHKSAPAFSVQYHPEASAGPHDSNYLFGQFREML